MTTNSLKLEYALKQHLVSNRSSLKKGISMVELSILDGGMGLELFKQGVPEDRILWSARALVDEQYHQKVIDVHQSYLDAGSSYLTTNNYAVIPGYLEKAGITDRLPELTKLAGRLALQAKNEWLEKNAGIQKDIKVLGCLPPLIESYRPDLVLNSQEAIAYYQVIAECLEQYVDLFLLETMSSLGEALSGAKVASNSGKGWFISWTLNERGMLRSGECINESISTFLNEGFIPDAIMFNCSAPESITLGLKNLSQEVRGLLDSKNIALGAYANNFSSEPDVDATVEHSAPLGTRFDVTPDRYLEFATQWHDMGCRLIGGCCGISPQYIARLSAIKDKESARLN